MTFEDTLHAQFSAVAASRPGEVAVSDGTNSLTYSELNERATTLARRLVAEGVGPGDLVEVRLGRSVRVPEAILGILRAGAAFLPVPPSLPAQRAATVVELAGPTAVVTDSGHAPSLAGRDRVVVIDETSDPGEAVQLPRVDGSALAYVMYTSGTTGRPKGVRVSHGNVLALLEASGPLFDLGHEDVWTMFHSYAFDFSVWEMWGALAFGGRLVIPPKAVTRSPDDFRRLLESEAVSVLSMTPSAFDTLTRVEREARDPLPALRLVVFGGEALRTAPLEHWFDRYGDRLRLVNMFGITEVTVHATHHALSRADLGRDRPSPIGRALPHVELRVCDDDGAPVPDGTVGELWIGGAGVAEGYHDDPDQTEQRFRKAEDGTRFYRSGDLVHRDQEGEHFYHRRADDQVQVRGFRVELGEIEHALESHEGVERAVVGYTQDPASGHGVLHCHFVSGGGAVPQADQLRAFLNERLPGYMIPNTFERLDSLPTNPSGKIDRDALARGAGSAALDPSDDPIEAGSTLDRVRAVWRQALGRNDIDPDTDFFEAGGHSLLAVDVLLRLQDEFGVEVPLGTLFTATTVRELTDVLEGLLDEVEEFEL